MARSITSVVVAAAAVLATTLAAGAAPASAAGGHGRSTVEKTAGIDGIAVTGAAAASTTTTFSIYGPPPLPGGVHGAAEGTITWNNRSANVSGQMFTGLTSTNVTFFFEAYAGSTKVASTTRTARGTDGNWQGFAFTLDASNVVGGFDRIKMQAKDNDAVLVGDPLNCYRTVASCANHS
jgi:hypothetical protein